MSTREPRGTLLAIGGAEDKRGRQTVLRRFVEAAGGDAARLVVVPTASSMGTEIVEQYDRLFRAMGAADVVALRPETRADADRPALSAPIANATGVFMSGGNQLKLSAVVTGTRFGDAIRAAYERGAAVGGTSAGASVIGEHMPAFGPGGSTPKQRMSQLAAGLGLLAGGIVDQHFQQRNRYGRLLYLVAQSPSLLGIGVDEDTAAVITQGRHLEVAGRGTVTIVDGRRVRSNAYEAKGTRPLLVSGAVVHVLPAGARFDLATRELAGFETGDTRLREVAE
ncbi:MAG: cyanophycinase [Acidimicrobiales bacterium]